MVGHATWSIAVCLSLLPACVSVQPKRDLQTLTQSVPTLPPWLESSNSGLSAGDAEGFSGVPFQTSLQPPAWSLPHHCYCSSISEEQPLPEVGVPSSAGTAGVHPPGETQPISGAAPGPRPFAPGCLAPLSQACLPPGPEQSVALPDDTGKHTSTRDRFLLDGNGLFDRNIGKIHKQ